MKMTKKRFEVLKLVRQWGAEGYYPRTRDAQKPCDALKEAGLLEKSTGRFYVTAAGRDAIRQGFTPPAPKRAPEAA